MQTHRITFPSSLKNATLKSFAGASLPAHVSGEIETDEARKLAKTQVNDAANVALLAESRKLLEAIEKQFQSLAESQQSNIEQFQELAIRLSTQIATAVVRYEVTHHETRIRGMIDSFRAEIGPAEDFVVRVNGPDLDRLKTTIPEHFTTESKIKFEPDDSIATGDCKIESTERIVYASYERQIEDIQSRLMESLHDARLERKNTDGND